MSRYRFQISIFILVSTFASLLTAGAAADDQKTTPTTIPENETIAPEAPPGEDELLDLSLEELLDIQVITTSRRSESMRTAPSNVSVITGDQIRARGYRDLQDVLRSVAGFLVLYDRDEWSYSARGFVSDNNQKYLILVDGHRMNSTENFGPGQINELPMDLGNVARIEVVRGPGSAVWGSEALAGVINIITLNGADLNGETVRARATYGNGLPGFDSHTAKANLQMGKKVGDDADLILSGAFVSSKGRVIQTDSSNGLSSPYWNETYCGADFCTDANAPEDQNSAPPYGRYKTDLNRFAPSYMLQGKARVGELTLNALYFHTRVKNRHFEANDLTTTPDGNYLNRKTWYTTDKIFLEGTWQKALPKDAELTVRASGDVIDSQFVPTAAPALFISWKEQRFLSSISSFIPFFDKRLDMNVGVDYSHTGYGPSVRFDSLVPGQTGAQVDNPDPAGDNDGLITNLTDDDNLGAFALMGVHVLNHRLHLSGGTRIDYNDTRGDEALAFAPRAALIYELKKWGLFKLVYNTGFLRPANFQRSDLPVDPERMHQVEFITMWNLDPVAPVTINLTGYWQQLEGIILIANSTASGYLGSGFTNTGNYQSVGAELEVLAKAGPHDLFGNLSLSRPTGSDYVDGLALDAMRIKPDKTGAQEGRLLNYPAVMFNVGSTLRFGSQFAFTPALRFQGPMTYRAAPPQNTLDDAVYRKSDPMAFLDATLIYTPIPALDIILNGRNLTNERGPEPISVWNGTRELYGTYVELSFALRR